MDAPRLRNRWQERLEAIADRLGPIGRALLWPVFEVLIWLGLLLFPIWLLVMLVVGPGKPPAPGRSAPDRQRKTHSD